MGHECGLERRRSAPAVLCCEGDQCRKTASPAHAHRQLRLSCSHQVISEPRFSATPVPSQCSWLQHLCAFFQRSAYERKDDCTEGSSLACSLFPECILWPELKAIGSQAGIILVHSMRRSQSWGLPGMQHTSWPASDAIIWYHVKLVASDLARYRHLMSGPLTVQWTCQT